MQSDKSKPKYVSSNRARTAGVRNFSGQNQFAQVIASTSATPVDEAFQKRKRLLMIIVVSALSVLVVLAMVVLALRRFTGAGAGDISFEEFNKRIEYHDAMKCTLYEGSMAKKSDYTVMASDGWKEVYLSNIWLAGDLTDVIYVNDLVYTIVYNGAKKDKNIVKDKSFIETKEQFANRTGLEFPDGLMLSEGDNRKIHCDAEGAKIKYHRPNVSRFTHSGEVSL